jgi:cytochrome c-type biogenesis protein CcmH/NrfG
MRSPSLVMHAQLALLLLSVLPVSLLAQSGDPQRGVKLFEERNYPAARSEFSAVLGRNPRDANALFYMGRIAIAEDRAGDAVGWFEKAVKANDNSSEYHLWLANALGEEAQRASSFANRSSHDA